VTEIAIPKLRVLEPQELFYESTILQVSVNPKVRISTIGGKIKIHQTSEEAGIMQILGKVVLATWYLYI
jgi:hypothetical protein